MRSLVTAAGISLPVTFGLFLLMANLIRQDAGLKKNIASENFIEFIRSVNNQEAQTRKRVLPKKPPEPKVAPKMPKVAIKADVPNKVVSPQMNMPALEAPLALGNGPYVGGGVGAGNASGNSEVLPLVRIEPRYPRKAAMAGKEGWVQLKFDITKAGTVADVSVMKSKPRRLFDKAAKQALYKWKYRPKLIDGKPVEQKNLMVQIDFKIQR